MKCEHCTAPSTSTIRTAKLMVSLCWCCADRWWADFLEARK